MFENIIRDTSTNTFDCYEDDYEPDYDASDYTYTYTYTYNYTYYNKKLF
jgi:hypothetical protein